MKETLKAILILFVYPVGLFAYVILNGYPSMPASIAILLSVPLVIAAAIKV